MLQRAEEALNVSLLFLLAILQLNAFQAMVHNQHLFVLPAEAGIIPHQELRV